MKTKKILISLISALVFSVQLAFAGGTPTNVTGLDATPIDANSIGLTWDTARDGDGGLVDHYRIYYGSFSVFEAGEGDYEYDVDTPNNNNSYVVSDLNPATPYYFSVTAISSDDLESEEYSFEVSATTLGEAEEEAEEPMEDTTSPTVTGVTAPDKMHVQVVFSEAVQLPAATPEASFGIVEQVNPANTLTVISAVIDAMDSTNKTVLLETSEQTADINYIVTAGVAIKDLAGNPIVSGNTDSGLFLGSAEEPVVAEEEMVEEEVMPEEEPVSEPEAETTEAPVAAENCQQDFGCFLKHIVDCSAGLVTEMDEQYEYKLELTGEDGANCMVKYTASKHPSLLFAGNTMDCKVVKGTYKDAEAYRAAFDKANCTGDLVDGYTATTLKDTTPPENVTNLLLTFREQLEKYVVMLSWTPSLNTAKDLVDQILYMSMDRGKSYDGGKPLGAVVAKTEVADLDGGKEYTFKMTTKDAAGNESTGAVKSIRLPQTGMGAGLLLLVSAFGARRALRRKEDDRL